MMMSVGCGIAGALRTGGEPTRVACGPVVELTQRVVYAWQI
jgi:hypothetical protein